MEHTQLSLFGKTYPAHSAATAARTLEPCCKNSRKSPKKVPLYLDLRRAGMRTPARLPGRLDSRPFYLGAKGRQKAVSDTVRYKALGNSIALPPWSFVLGRVSEHLPHGAKLGSLFDGIGGFPLVWERIHGRGTALWASEIEPFCIAVTRHWLE